MTPARYRAYQNAREIIEELADETLSLDERALLLDTAEGLLLTRDGQEGESERLLADASTMLSGLFGSQRATAAQSESLWTVLAACGPLRPGLSPGRQASLTGV